MVQQPITHLDERYSSDGAAAMPWSDAADSLQSAQVYWLTTVRPNGRPHVTPVIAVWLERALYFSTGPEERKARNLASNVHCVMTTGCNTMDGGFDLVIEGDATRVRDDAELRRVAEAYESKYGSDWHFEVRDGAFHHTEGEAYVFALPPDTAFGFGKGATFSQTRWRF